MAQTKIRLGTASPGTQETTADTLRQLEALAHDAAEKDIDILLLPEAYIGGYPRGTHFGSTIGGRSAEGREEYLRYFRTAVDLGDTVGDGAGAGAVWIKRALPAERSEQDGTVSGRGDGTREELERIAKESGVFLVVGCIEKAGGSMYCSAVYVDPARGVIGKRRKVMPTGTERLVWAQGSPATLQAVSTTIKGVRINLAAAICWENYMPLVRQALYSQNVNLYLAPTADGRDAWLPLMRTIAIEGRCFVLSSNMCVRGPEAQGGKRNTASRNGRAHLHPQFENGNGTANTATPKTNGHRRRSSCMTKDGFEIALPPRPSVEDEVEAEVEAPQPSEHEESVVQDVNPFLNGNGNGTASQRRNSCLTEDGFEIALPLAKKSKTEQRTRRKSVIDEHGNQIVLCCDETISEEEEDVDNAEAVTSGSEAERPVSPRQAMRRHANGGTAETKDSFISRGGSCIVSPFGDVLAGPQWEDDGNIIYTDVDFEDCIRGRLDLDIGGSYSRNDSFKFSVEGLNLHPLPY